MRVVHLEVGPGYPIDLCRTARSLRGARDFVILIDSSCSAAEHAGPMLRFARALCLQSRRANASVYSTALRDATGALRERDRTGRSLPELGKHGQRHMHRRKPRDSRHE